MKGGIIARSDRKSLFKRIFVLKLSEDVFCAEINFSGKINEKIISKRICRAKKLLAKCGVQNVIFTSEMKSLVKMPLQPNKALFVSSAYNAAREIAQKFGVFPPYKIVISEEKPSSFAKQLIMNFIFDFDLLCLAAKDISAAERLCSEIMSDTGAYIIFSTDAKITPKTVTLDIDRCEIRIGRAVCASRFEPAGENYGYNIDLAELFAIQKKPIKVKTYFLGKNKLTLGL